MTIKYRRNFRVRHYECDGYGHLNNVNYVRWMQETALDASADVGWDIAAYESIGQMWLIRETQIDYLEPAQYDDTITITTWVADFRHVQSRRMYEFHKGNNLIARATTNWVYLDSATQRPARIPEEVKRAFMPDENDNAPTVDRFPDMPPHPEEPFSIVKPVEWRDLDSVGHVNNATYFAYFEDVSTHVGRHYGWGIPQMKARQMAMILREMRLLYLRPAVIDDEVRITCWLSDAKRATVTRHYTIHRVRDDTLLARGRGLWVCFDTDKMRPRRIPQAMMSDFANNIV